MPILRNRSVFSPIGRIGNGKRPLDRKFDGRCLELESQTLADISGQILQTGLVSVQKSTPNCIATRSALLLLGGWRPARLVVTAAGIPCRKRACQDRSRHDVPEGVPPNEAAQALTYRPGAAAFPLRYLRFQQTFADNFG